MVTRIRSYTNWRKYDSSIETILNDLKNHSFEEKANQFLELFPNIKVTCIQIIKRLKFIKYKQKIDVENIIEFNNIKPSSITNDVIQNQIQSKIVENQIESQNKTSQILKHLKTIN